MAASMWRMNGLWRRMAGVLVLGALLLSSGAMCQEDSTVAPTNVPTTAPPGSASAGSSTPDAPSQESSGATVAPNTDANSGNGDPSASTPAPKDGSIPVTIVTVAVDSGKPGGRALDLGASDAVAATNAPPVEVPREPALSLVVPDVQCVAESDIPENAVKAEVTTADCEASKAMIQANPAPWCPKENCNLKIFQDGNMMKITSEDAALSTLAGALQSEHLKDKLGVTKTETPSSSGSSVFVGILVSGLLAALGITIGYFKCQRKSDPKGVRLAEEAYPADQENQGNTLVSVAPLNPPPETPEKPSVNGESPEAAKTQPPPPTNGHSTTKTADTEL